MLFGFIIELSYCQKEEEMAMMTYKTGSRSEVYCEYWETNGKAPPHAFSVTRGIERL